MPRFVLRFPIKKPDCKVRLSREIDCFLSQILLDFIVYKMQQCLRYKENSN